MPAQNPITLEVLLHVVGVEAADVVTVPAAADPAETTEALDAVLVDAEPPLVRVEGADALGHAFAWVADRAGWMVLIDSGPDVGVLAPIATLAGDPVPPGRWRGARQGPAEPGPGPAAPAGELARAYSARAALVDSQRHEVDRLRAQLIEQRAWVASEAGRIRESQSWRLGHAFMRVSRLVTLRRGRGTDALQRILDRMNEPVE